MRNMRAGVVQRNTHRDDDTFTSDAALTGFAVARNDA
jgi:hypothetical protein